MTTITVNLMSEPAIPNVQILESTHSTFGERFAVLNFTPECTVILPGRDQNALRYLRQLAVLLDKAANTLEDTLEMDARDKWADATEARMQAEKAGA